jgi:ABC-type nitrate/sulfonate/bicarbonate transport system substrate-binding protein
MTPGVKRPGGRRVLLVALLLGSQACAPAASTATPAATAVSSAVGAPAGVPVGAAPPALRTVRVTVPTKSITFLPLYYGQDKGILREEGIALDPVVMKPPVGIAALESGDVTYSAAPGVGMRAALQGAPVRAVMFMQTRPSFSLVGQPGLTPDRIERVAVSSLRSTAHYAAMNVMRKLGRGGPDDATYFATNETVQSYAALAGRVADAAILTPPYTSMATQAGFTYLGDAFDMQDVQGGLVTTERRIQAERAEVKALLRGLLRALDHLVRQPAEATAYLQQEFDLDPGVAAGSYEIITRVLNESGDLDAPALRAVVEQMKQDAELTDDVALDRVVDLAPLREAQAELDIRK